MGCDRNNHTTHGEWCGGPDRNGLWFDPASSFYTEVQYFPPPRVGGGMGNLYPGQGQSTVYSVFLEPDNLIPLMLGCLRWGLSVCSLFPPALYFPS